jgi:hypothetical protein
MSNSKWTAVFVVFVLAKSIECGWADPPLPASPMQTPINQQATADAWAAFKAGKYEIAITKANECIDRFQSAADGIQAILEGKNAALPTGVPSIADRQKIGQYQILHDVATCLLIRAWAEEKRGKTNEAIKAYAKVKKYSFARTSEKAGEPLWSPAELAAQQLRRLSP